MVLLGCRSEQEIGESESAKMAMGPERSWSLHNSSLPCLKWGERRKIRYVRSQDNGEFTDGGIRFRAFGRRSPPSSSKPHRDSGGVPERKRRYGFEFQPSTVAVKAEIRRSADDGIEAVRKKLMLDLQTEMDQMKFSVLSRRSEEIALPPTKTEAAPPAEERPWNLRSRRPVCKRQRVDEGYSSFPTAMKSPASNVGILDHGGVRRPRTKVSVPLSKQEIEDDFIAMTGVRPPRKPKKRPRNIQKQLDTLFPGVGLSEITADKYKVNENPAPRKR